MPFFKFGWLARICQKQSQIQGITGEVLACAKGMTAIYFICSFTQFLRGSKVWVTHSPSRCGGARLQPQELRRQAQATLNYKARICPPKQTKHTLPQKQKNTHKNQIKDDIMVSFEREDTEQIIMRQHRARKIKGNYTAVIQENRETLSCRKMINCSWKVRI